MDRNLMLWKEDHAVVVAQHRSSAAVSRCYFDPSLFNDVVGMDFGSGQAHFYSSDSGQAWQCPAESAMSEILGLRRGTALIAEWAHLAVPRTKKSLAQPFSSEQLLELYEKARGLGITIKLFPHYHSGTRARPWAAKHFPGVQSEKKTDAADAMSLAIYVTCCNGVSLADPPSSFDRCPKRDYGKAVRVYSSIALNAERTTGYRGIHFPSVVGLGNEIFRKRGKSIGRNACYSIASLIATDTDSCPVVFVRGNSPPGVDFWWKNVAMMSPFHHKAGIARSNLMRHSFRPFLRKFGVRNGVRMGDGTKITPFGHHNELQASIKTAAIKSFRDAVKDCYRVGVQTASAMGFGELDPSRTPWEEDTDGR